MFQNEKMNVLTECRRCNCTKTKSKILVTSVLWLFAVHCSCLVLSIWLVITQILGLQGDIIRTCVF